MSEDGFSVLVHIYQLSRRSSPAFQQTQPSFPGEVAQLSWRSSPGFQEKYPSFPGEVQAQLSRRSSSAFQEKQPSFPGEAQLSNIRKSTDGVEFYNMLLLRPLKSKFLRRQQSTFSSYDLQLVSTLHTCATDQTGSGVERLDRKKAVPNVINQKN